MSTSKKFNHKRPNHNIMKAIGNHLLFLILLFGLAGSGWAQDQVAIPLSNPGEPGMLKLGAVRGSINVTGYEGNEVIIRYGGETDKGDEREVTERGLRRISSGGIGFEAVEDDNEVKISGVSPMRDIHFDISVPHNFSLKLSLVNGDEIIVENVSGEMEISHVNGDVSLVNVGGSAVVNTVNGDLKATFNSVSADRPMAFSNLNGDIDITLPANTKLTAKMKSDWGEIYTDFDMQIDRARQDDVQATDSGVYKVSVNNWIYGRINGGGPEYLFKSMRGDIYIRKRNQ